MALPFENDTEKITKKLSIRYLQGNKTQGRIVIFAIIITTMLFTSVFTILHGAYYSALNQMLRQNGSSFDAEFKFITEEQLNRLQEYPSFSSTGVHQYLALAENKELQSLFAEISCADAAEAKGRFSYPTIGVMPSKHDEIAVNTYVLDLLGIPHEIGQTIPLSYSLNGEKKEHNFTLSGYWEAEENMDFCYLWVSKDFAVRELSNAVYNTPGYAEPGYFTLSINFSNHRGLEKKVYQSLADCGFSLDSTRGNPDYLDFNINSAYNSTNGFTFVVVLAVTGLLLLILLSGYLIIYNIFQISVEKDIQMYGQLKTIGTSARQIKKIVRRQARRMSMIGIPIGLLLGYGSGLLLLPLVLSSSNYKAEYIAPVPFIFIIAAILAYITVFISCQKPARVAANISPIMAVRYIGEFPTGIKNSILRKGTLLHRMAVANLFRNKKKTILIVMSFSLSIILLNSILTFTNSFQSEIYVERRLACDYAVSDVYNDRITRPNGSGINKSMTEQINQTFPVGNGGAVYYYSPAETNVSDIQALVANITGINKTAMENKLFMQLYGFEQFPFSLCNVIEGELDWEKFSTGNYVIEFASYNNNMEVYRDEYQFTPGDKITFECGGKEQEYEVLALVACRNILTSGTSMASYSSLMLPADTFLSLYPDSLPIRYLFNADLSSHSNIEQWLKSYAGDTEHGIKYTSRTILTQEFNDIKYTYIIAGGILSLLFAVIGILNFINVIITNIFNRKQELSVMQSVGMTRKQTKKLLLFEGGLYVMWSFLLATVLSIAISVLLIQPLTAGIWYCQYRFTLLPVLMMVPAYAIIAFLVPYKSIKTFFKKSIVDNLRTL